MKLTLRKSIPLWVVVALVIGASFGTTAAAMTIFQIPIEHISLFQSQQAASNFNIQSQVTRFHGPNKVVVHLTLTNTDSSNSHSANVTVSILNSSGNEILDEAQLTGTVAASGSVTLTYTFDQAGITDSYGSTFVQVSDTN